MDLASRYKIQARIYPGVLAALPVLVIAIPIIPSNILMTLAPVLAASGILFLASHIVRAQGVLVEQKLLHKWGGFPTTRMLRHSDNMDDVDFLRRRAKLEKIYGETLPTTEAEGRDPEAADRRYESAIRALIVRVDLIRNRFPRVEDENISYGFRRNMLGIKRVALSIILCAFIIDAFIMFRSGITPPLLFAAFVQCALLAVWLLFVRDAQVQAAAMTYARRLFEALDALDEASSEDIG